jgi:arylsulfatase A-like enzyme
VRDQLVANIDLAPTIVDITGVRARLLMDGISLLPLAKNASAAAGRALLFESYDFNSYGIREGEWQYNEYANGDEELYDLDADPYELSNVLYPNPSTYAATRTQLRTHLAQLKGCDGPSCR